MILLQFMGCLRNLMHSYSSHLITTYITNDMEEDDTGHPVQPTEEPTPPALTSATHTLKDAPGDQADGTMTPYKQSFS